jgi:hypothetical protein
MKDKKLKLPGLPPIPIISDEEAEKVDYLVCVPWGTPSPFDDNLKGICSHCGRDVQYRWHAPRKPKRLCVDCWVKLENKVASSPYRSQTEFDK